MKIFLLSPPVSGNIPDATLMADTSILRPGRPFYIPDWDDAFTLHPTLAFRIDRLGKSIAARFAPRYIASMAPAALALPGSALKALRAGKVAGAMECAYDYAMPLGEWHDISDIPDEVVINARDTAGQEAEWLLSAMTIPIGQRLEILSRRFTIKTGDIIVCPPVADGIVLNIGEKVAISIDGRESFEVPVK